MKKKVNRRKFIRSATVAGIGLGLGLKTILSSGKDIPVLKGKRVGIIGLDTSHSPAFTKALNSPEASPELNGYRVVVAYPRGSSDIESSTKRIPGYTEEVKKYGVTIVDSVKKLLQEADMVLLETNDGRLHLEQVLPVLKAGKRVFIDKPLAASLQDVLAIFEAAAQYKVPVFSSSSLRFLATAQEVRQGKAGKVLGADAFSPATIEKTHPDLFWYGIHGVETLFTVMGTGCKSVVRLYTESTDIVVGTWSDNRVGTFRGTRSGTHEYGGTVFGEKSTIVLGSYTGYDALLKEIINFFDTGQPPVTPEETIEIYAFMQAADESKRQGGQPVTLESVLQKAKPAKIKK